MLRVKQARRRLGLSQEVVSILTGIDAATISRLENGKLHPYPGWAKRLGEALEIPAETVFEEVPADGEAST